MMIFTFCLLRSGRFLFFVLIVPPPFTSVCRAFSYQNLSQAGSIWSRQSVVKEAKKQKQKKKPRQI